MDELTKCLCIAGLDELWLSQQMKLVEQQACLISFDCDALRMVNAWLGWQEGDRKLVGVAATLRSLLPKSDIVRVGSDDFFAVASTEKLSQLALKSMLAELVDYSVYLDVDMNFCDYIPPPDKFTVSCCAIPISAEVKLPLLLELDRYNRDTIANRRHEGSRGVTVEGDFRRKSVAITLESRTPGT